MSVTFSDSQQNLLDSVTELSDKKDKKIKHLRYNND